jgi:hypothetical protein
MKTQIEKYKLVGRTYQYQVKQVAKIGGVPRIDTAKLVALTLEQVETKEIIRLSDGDHPGMYQQVCDLFGEHFDYSTSLKFDIVLILNDILLTFESNIKPIGSFNPRFVELTNTPRQELTEEEWLRVMYLIDLDTSGKVLQPPA